MLSAFSQTLGNIVPLLQLILGYACESAVFEGKSLVAFLRRNESIAMKP
jgi:hypothetical protein